MPPAVFNAVLPILGMLIATNVCFAFGVNAVPDFAVIAAITSVALAIPFGSATAAFLFVAATADLCMSGPPGVVLLTSVLLFLTIRLLSSRIQPQHIVSIAISAGVATAVLHLSHAFIYSLYYKDVPFLKLYILNDWKAILATAVFAPVMAWLTNKIADLFNRQKKNKLT